MDSEPQTDRFLNFGTGDGCDKMLPTNQIKSKYNYYKVNIFEIPDLTEDLLDIQDFHFIQGTSRRALSMVLPPQLYLKSDAIHAASQMAMNPELNRTLGFDVAISNYGCFLPLKNMKLFKDQVVRRVVVLKDLNLLNKNELEFDGRKIITDKTTRKALIDDGVAYAVTDEKIPRKVKIVIDPDRILAIDDLSHLRAKKEVILNKKKIKVAVSDQQLRNLAQGQYAFASVGHKPVWLKSRKLPSSRNPILDIPPKNSPNLSFAASPMSLWQMLEKADEQTFCTFYATVAADERAPDDMYAPDAQINTQIAENLKNLSDDIYLEILNFFMQDPRTEKCRFPAPVSSLPFYEIALLTTFEQEWELLGYSKGALISSINLAPREEMQIEMFSWNRHKVEQEKEFGAAYEFNREINNQIKADTTITRDMKEALNGYADVSGNIGLPTSKVKLEGGVDAGAEGSVEKNLASDVNLISEGSIKSAEKFKTTHRVKIVETHEFGEENRTIRKLNNPNASRTLTFNHFEILENYKVTTRLKDACTFCLLIENPDFPPFDLDFVLAYEYRLQQVLLSPNYHKGFDASRLLAAQRWFDNNSGIEESLNRPNPTPDATQPGLPSEPDSQDSDKPLVGIFGTAENIYEILTDFIELDVQAALITLVKHLNPFSQHAQTMKAVQDAQAAVSRYCFWLKLTGIYPGFDQQARAYVHKVKDRFGKQADEQFILNQLSQLVEYFDDDWLYAVKMVAAGTVVQTIMKLPFLIAGPFAPIAMGIIEPAILPLAYNSDDMGLSKAIGSAKRNIMPIVDTQNALITNEQVELPGTTNYQPSIQPIQIPQLYSYREIAEAHADFTKLIAHLEKHRIFYSNEIWRGEDENERYRRLELMGLASFVENRILGFAGKKAIYPLLETSLPDGIDLMPLLPKMEVLSEEEKQVEEQISVPTPGVHIDTVLGQCESLEPFLLDMREFEKQQRKIEISILEQESLQEELETQRLRLRLEQAPPLLDDPHAVSGDTE